MTDFSKPWKKRTGLTLIEVMLSIVILAIGSGILMVAIGRCMAVATKAQHYSTARHLLLQVETENPITRADLSEGTESGSIDDTYSWEREIIKNETEERDGLYTIRTRIGWSARGKDAFEEVTEYRYIKPEDTL